MKMRILSLFSIVPNLAERGQVIYIYKDLKKNFFFLYSNIILFDNRLIKLMISNRNNSKKNKLKKERKKKFR